jgi:DNA-binding LacI/PurR family transcriptional regulator
VIDHTAVGVCAAEYLLGHGHRQLAVAVPREAGSRDIGEAQLQGVERVAVARGVRVQRVDLAFDEQEAARLAVRWAQQPHPSAVFAHDDEYGVLLMQALLDAGIAVPGQIAMVGADDLALCSLVRPRLTSIHLDVAASAETVAHLLHSMILGNETEVEAVELLRPRMVPRESA